MDMATSAPAAMAAGAAELPRAKRPYRSDPPADLKELAAKMHRSALAAHYGVHFTVIKRWLAATASRTAKPPLVGTAVGRPVPENFAETAAEMNRTQLRQRYNVGEGTLERWIKLTGAKPLFNRRMWGAPPSYAPPSVPSDVASQAAQHLRRFHSAVYSCSILPGHERAKIPNKGIGRWYVAGKGYLDAAELVAAAQAKGFDAGAWARL